ncbi:hypothetical protein ACIP4Y_36535 [Streptomyces sp. NPDC088810]|uniref:hypothetical protein n=1 Tax=Streptomyces sp. NPDC088810 TaxID=3365904 RepID=UPI00380E87E5
MLKVATVEWIQQISAPHKSYRHTDKKTPSERKQARTASHLGAFSDLRKHGLVENGGKTSGGDTLRNLTPMGLKAASCELGRPVGEMGGSARGAGRSGASHPMAPNDALLALLRPKPDLTQLDGEPVEVLAAAQAAADPPDGLGPSPPTRRGQGRDACTATTSAYDNWDSNTSTNARILRTTEDNTHLNDYNFNDVTSSAVNNSCFLVRIYPDYEFKGVPVTLLPGESISFNRGNGFNDVASSVQFLPYCNQHHQRGGPVLWS